MPTICKFLGIVIKMHFAGQEHNPPHVHVYVGEKSALMKIEDGSIMQGAIPQNKIKLAKSFVEAYKKELLEMWETENIYYIDEK